MTVAELIKALEKIDDKSLEVVADIEIDFCDNLKAKIVEEVIETEEYFGTADGLGWCACKRHCAKII